MESVYVKNCIDNCSQLHSDDYGEYVIEMYVFIDQGQSSRKVKSRSRNRNDTVNIDVDDWKQSDMGSKRRDAEYDDKKSLILYERWRRVILCDTDRQQYRVHTHNVEESCHVYPSLWHRRSSPESMVTSQSHQ